MQDRVLTAALSSLLKLSRPTKQLIQILVDSLLLVVSFASAIWLRLEGFSFVNNPKVWLAMVLALPPTIVLFAALGLYRSVVRFVSLDVLRTIMFAVLISAALLFLIDYSLSLPIPDSVPAIYWLLAMFSMTGVRLAMRGVYALSQRKTKKPVIIYGAGDSGRQLSASLHRGPEYAPVAFVDDSKELQGVAVAGLRVYSPQLLPSLIQSYGATTLLLAMPSMKQSERRVVLERVKDLPVEVRTVPGIADIVAGKASISDLREVAIEELLGRDPVPPQPELMRESIAGKVVMVTGAGGSIGSELCRQILSAKPTMLILFEQSEFALYTIHDQLFHLAALANVRLVPILGSVCDAVRMERTMQSFHVNTVYHAAAYKHVPMVEYNVVEGIRNNVFGTLITATAAAAAGVGAFILVSTDKAVRPTNVMGASKRMAELVCQALAQQHKGIVFSMVRFGNVLGSSGSVIPLFRRQIASGGPITVTDPEITRYFMTIPEAAQLVIQAGAMARGGDVFVLDMGEPVRIVDLAERMIRLHGLRPSVLPLGSPSDTAVDGDIAIIFNGLRPGEKLYEELLIGVTSSPTKHPRIMAADEVRLDWKELGPLLDQMAAACDQENVVEIQKILKAAKTAYAPMDDISDVVWREVGVTN